MHFAAKDKKLHCFPKKPSLKTHMSDVQNCGKEKNLIEREREVKN